MQKCLERAFILALLLLFVHGTSAAAQYAPDCYVSVPLPEWFATKLSPGIPWPVWSKLLGVGWRKDQIARAAQFDETSVLAALNRISTGEYDELVAPNDAQFGRYRPYLDVATPEQTAAYEAAAEDYREGQWADSIPKFDAIVADLKSPYRAAAAYSAARATFRLEDLHGGIERIAQLVADPSLEEFNGAAHHLLGTLSYLTGNARILAARYAEIVHLITMPPEVACHVSGAVQLMRDASYGLYWYLGEAFPFRNFVDFPEQNPNETSAHRVARLVLDRLAENDPVLDLARVLAAPTPFRDSENWDIGRRLLDEPGDQDEPAGPDSRTFAASGGALLTAHAREQWLATKNVLWGYALAQRAADLSDAKLIDQMIGQLDFLPDEPLIRASLPYFYWHFVSHKIRLLLMNGRFDDAIAALPRGDLPKYLSLAVPSSRLTQIDEKHRIVFGGIFLFYGRFDLDRARRWAEESSKALGLSTSSMLLLSDSVDVPGAIRNESSARETIAAIVDLLPARKMVAIAQESKNLNLAERRAIFSAGWLRLYLLGDWQQTKALLPRLKQLFPELTKEIDESRGTWFDQTKRHLIVRMLLRAPGFTLRAVLSGRQNARRFYRKTTIFDVDTANPNDGNWWCPLDIDDLKVLLVNDLFVGPLGLREFEEQNGGNADPDILPAYYPKDSNGRLDVIALADKIIAWHPLLKDVDFDELAKLAIVSSGPRLLTERTLEWADSSGPIWRFFGLDRQLPETLHFAVRSTRYGCRRAGGHGSYSRAAFARLHSEFPSNEWTKRTPYWFDVISRR